MALPAATYISELDPYLPNGDLDSKSEGDDWLKLLQQVLQNQFPNLGAAAVTPTAAQLNTITAKATKTGDTYSGTHDFSGATLTTGTAAFGTSTTAASSTAFVQAAVAGVNANGALALVTLGAATYTASAGQRIVTQALVPTTITLPASPSPGNVVSVKITGFSGAVDTVVARNGQKIEGLEEDMTLDLSRASVYFMFLGDPSGWVLV